MQPSCDPTQSAATTNANGTRRNPFKWLRRSALITAILAAACVSLGVADVTNSFFGNCCQTVSNACSTVTAAIVLTWIAVGIWGALPIFLTALYAIFISPLPNKKQRSRLKLSSGLSAVVLPLVIIIISCIELATKFSAGLTSTTFGNSFQYACLAIPLSIIVVAILLVLFCLYLHMLSMRSGVDDETKQAGSTQAPPPCQPCQPSPSPAHACVQPPAQPAQPVMQPVLQPMEPLNYNYNDDNYNYNSKCTGCDMDSERLNIWAWKRWSNYQPPKRAIPYHTAVPACMVTSCPRCQKAVLAGDAAGASGCTHL